ncbi:PhzF family phenazine biosynthesis protein [Symbioplanes lichenis]|uniref:PhzF family phenazine biosynthesis protein n=1 Tax=Symbioplanes lichenis TaxID=1629072 RepID=UPI002739A88C|nr:PhzF family phenazine biosynthesis protein [Actinoplanes lichenis]
MTAAAPPPYLVDAFVTDDGGGNRAAVVLIDESRPDEWLQSVAADLGAPATTFVRRRDDGSWALRWFSPFTELRSCGHGTLAAAQVLSQEFRVPAPLHFATALGPVSADRAADGFRFNFPAQTTEPWSLPAWAWDALGLRPVEVRRSGRHCLVRVAEVADVLGVRPDLAALRRLPTIGLAVTTQGSGRFDIVTRWFVAREGVEDQATGTAHTLVGPFWAERLARPDLTAWQASERGGHLTVTVAGDQVLLGGRAVTIVRGEPVDPWNSGTVRGVQD